MAANEPEKLLLGTVSLRSLTNGTVRVGDSRPVGSSGFVDSG